jgi:trans-aconitate methyltransferase
LLAEESYWGSKLVRSYVHNSELQRRWAIAFLAPQLKQLHGEEIVLDIGCGDGKLTADISKFIPKGIIVGIDPSKPMLDWARKQYCKKEYPNLFFHEGGFLGFDLPWKFDVVISNCALQHCLNHEEAFQRLSQILNPKGKLLLLIPAMDNSAWKQAYKKIHGSEKWSAYWEHIPPRKFLSLEEYDHLLRKSNFMPLRIEKVITRDPFVDREEFLNFLLGTFSPCVPENMLREFYSELIDEYISSLPEAIDQEGVIQARFSRVEIEAELSF